MSPGPEPFATTVTGTASVVIGPLNVNASGDVPMGLGYSYIAYPINVAATGVIGVRGHGQIVLGQPQGIVVRGTGHIGVRGSGHIVLGGVVVTAFHENRVITEAVSRSTTDAEAHITQVVQVMSGSSTPSLTAASAALTKDILQPPGADTGVGVESITGLSIRAALLDHYLDHYVLPDVKHWELENERFRHDQALFRYGEYAIFVTMWTLQDFTAGLVSRCRTCYTPEAPLTETWKQPAYAKCPSCLGTSFEGGYKAILVRPSLWTWDEQTQQQVQRGVINTNVAQVQTTSDFRLQPRDYIIRGDGSRWQSQEVIGDHLDTGFGTQAGIWNATGFIYNNVTREDESSVIYLLPISEDYIQKTIPQWYSRVPAVEF